jgi:uncharacterized membrane protein YedE/YeeE
MLSISNNQERMSYTRLLTVCGLTCLSVGFVFEQAGQKQAGVLLLGFLLGVVLFYTTFSFSNGWRRLVAEKKSLWFRAQMLMIIVASLLMLPALGEGSLWGGSVRGYVRPLGLSLVVGAFVFGVGMQLAGSCASGALYNAGGGRLKMLIVIFMFALGALLGTAHYEWWMEQINVEPVNFLALYGVWGAVVINLVIAGILYYIFRLIEMRKYQRVEALWGKQANRTGKLLLSGALALAVLNFITLGYIGRPWSVANAFPLWGAKTTAFLGMELDLDFWAYWTEPAAEQSLSGGLLDHVGSVMNLGVVGGALAISALTVRFNMDYKVKLTELLTISAGGLMLGYGAIIGFGCNVGAFFSGVVSGSLHGWVWFLAALLGTTVVVMFKKTLART